jgi:DNA invertase Pin-like site-specific DNA recombinase
MARRLQAVAYLRTSSATNIGLGKDTDQRQRLAIQAYAEQASIDLVGEYYDAAVSGADPVDQREGFAAMLQWIAANDVHTVIVETANRFARDLIIQETGYRLLKERGIDLIAADSPTAFLDNGPTSRLIRQILGAVSEFDKAMTVAKLKGARERKRKVKGWCEGGLPLEQRYPEAIAAAKKLYRRHPKTGKRRSLRQISTLLAAHGHVMTAKYRGVDEPRPFNAATVQALLRCTSLKPES